MGRTKRNGGASVEAPPCDLPLVTLALEPAKAAGRREQARSQQNQRGRLRSRKQVLVRFASDAGTTTQRPGVTRGRRVNVHGEEHVRSAAGRVGCERPDRQTGALHSELEGAE